MRFMAETRYIEGQGRYELSEMVGRGGFATVWRARSVGRRGEDDVAIKIIPVYSAAERSRALREGQIAEGLKHRNIVEPLEVIAGDLEIYLVTEYIDGVPLDLAARSYSLDEVIESLAQILEALVYAHEKGIVHRDIKPQNALVDGSGRVKLTDFGIAFRAGDTRLTQVGFAVGTPGYIAPETIDGAEPSALSDIYAVGATARALLAYQPEELPPRLLEFVNRTTSPNPDHRPQSARSALALLTGRRGDRRPAEREARGGAVLIPERYSGYVLRGVNGMVAGWLGYLGGGILLGEAGTLGVAAGFGAAGYLLPRLGALGVIVALAVALARSGVGLGFVALVPAAGLVWIILAQGGARRLPLGPMLAVPLAAVGLGAGLPLLLGTLMRPLGASLSAAAGALTLVGYELTRGGGELRYLGVAPGRISGNLGPAELAAQVEFLAVQYPEVLLQAALWAGMAGVVSLSEKWRQWALGVLVAVGGGILGYALVISESPDALSRAMASLGFAAIIYGLAKYIGSRSKG